MNKKNRTEKDSCLQADLRVIIPFISDIASSKLVSYYARLELSFKSIRTRGHCPFKEVIMTTTTHAIS